MTIQNSKKFILFFSILLFSIASYFLFVAKSESFKSVKENIHNDNELGAQCGGIKFIWPTNIRLYEDPKDRIHKTFYNTRIFCEKNNFEINYSSYKNQDGKYIVEKNNP